MYAVLLIICIVVACIISFILWTPIMLIVDTTVGQYEIRMRGVASCSLHFEEYKPLLFLKIFGWTKIFDPTSDKREKRTSKQEKVTKVKKRVPYQKVMKKAKAILFSFRVRYLYLDLDTDDYVLNGLLYPAALMLSRKNATFNINFVGVTQLQLLIENRLGKILFAYLS